MSSVYSDIIMLLHIDTGRSDFVTRTLVRYGVARLRVHFYGDSYIRKLLACDYCGICRVRQYKGTEKLN